MLQHFVKGQEFKSPLTVQELPFAACSAIVIPEADAPEVSSAVVSVPGMSAQHPLLIALPSQ